MMFFVQHLSPPSVVFEGFGGSADGFRRHFQIIRVIVVVVNQARLQELNRRLQTIHNSFSLQNSLHPYISIKISNM